MAKIYVKMIRTDRMTLNDVPLRWREEVQKLLGESNE